MAAILHGNEWRDISEDTRAGITTLSSRLGRDFAHYAYLGMTLGAYVLLGLAVAFRLLPPAVMVALLSLPLLAVVIRSAELGAGGQARAIAMIDLQTARDRDMTFGCVAGLSGSACSAADLMRPQTPKPSERLAGWHGWASRLRRSRPRSADREIDSGRA